MRALLVFLLFLIFAVFARWWYVCEYKGLCGEQKSERPMTLSLMDGDEKILEGFEQFQFDATRISPNLTGNNKEYLNKVAAYMRANPDKHLSITGYFRPSEADFSSGFFENIGIARADRIRGLLVRNGIDEERITLDYKQSPSEELTEPMAFSTYLPTPDDFDKIAFTFTNMTYSDANFEYNSAKFQPGTQLKSYADSVKTFLELNPGKMLRIIGHTDSIGSDAFNNNLGLKRAEEARNYFKGLGVASEIEVGTAGKTRPVAANSKMSGEDNPEGRQKNRRVNFIIEDNKE